MRVVCRRFVVVDCYVSDADRHCTLRVRAVRVPTASQALYVCTVSYWYRTGTVGGWYLQTYRRGVEVRVRVQAGLQIRAYGRIREFLIEFLSKSGGGNRSEEEIPSFKSRAFQNFYRGKFGKLDKLGECITKVSR